MAESHYGEDKSINEELNVELHFAKNYTSTNFGKKLAFQIFYRKQTKYQKIKLFSINLHFDTFFRI